MNKRITILLIISALLGSSLCFAHYYFKKTKPLEIEVDQAEKEQEEIKPEEKKEEKEKKEEEKEEIKKISNHWIMTWKGELFFIAVSVAIGLIVVLINFLYKKIKYVINETQYGSKLSKFRKLFLKLEMITHKIFTLLNELNEKKIVIPEEKKFDDLENEINEYEKRYRLAVKKYNNDFNEKFNEIKKEITKNVGEKEEAKNYHIKKDTNFKMPVISLIDNLMQIEIDFLFELASIRNRIIQYDDKENNEKLVDEIKKEINKLEIEEKEVLSNKCYYTMEKFYDENKREIFFKKRDTINKQDWSKFSGYDNRIFNSEIKFKIRFYVYKFPRFFKFFDSLDEHIKKIFFVTIGVFEILLLPLISAYKVKFGKKSYLKRLSSIYCHSYKFIIDTVIAIILIIIVIVLIKKNKENENENQKNTEIKEDENEII